MRPKRDRLSIRLEDYLMRRREFIAGLGSAAAWPVAAGGQQGERMRRVGVLMGFEESNLEAKAFLFAFTQGLTELGWTDGRNVRIDVRWAAGSVDRARMFAKELVDLQPDVIFVSTTPVTAAIQRETRTIPIVFAFSSGFDAGPPRPGANITGFIGPQASLAGKWLELLTEIAPGIKRVAILFNPDTADGGGSYFLPPLEAAARSLKVEPIAGPIYSDADIETVMASLGREPGGGVVVMPGSFMVVHRAPIILLAARNRVPAVYFLSIFSKDGGLLSYGVDNRDVYRRAAPYVDSILRGAKPSDLPVQLPIKFELFLNTKTATALGVAVSPSIRLRADEVIE
jgi:putative tryptophan/tyrosine transport system substrate-binding protein